MKSKIMETLENYHQKQGVAFLSEKDAQDYFKGLVEIIESFYYQGLREVGEPPQGTGHMPNIN